VIRDATVTGVQTCALPISGFVTVVTPTYNEASNIIKLLEALYALPVSTLRVLVVDDSSPDGTGQMVEQLKSTYRPRLDILHRAEIGRASCRERVENNGDSG